MLNEQCSSTVQFERTQLLKVDGFVKVKHVATGGVPLQAPNTEANVSMNVFTSPPLRPPSPPGSRGRGSWSGYGFRPRSSKGIADHCCSAAGCDLQLLEKYCDKPKRPTPVTTTTTMTTTTTTTPTPTSTPTTTTTTTTTSFTPTANFTPPTTVRHL